MAQRKADTIQGLSAQEESIHTDEGITLYSSNNEDECTIKSKKAVKQENTDKADHNTTRDNVTDVNDQTTADFTMENEITIGNELDVKKNVKRSKKRKKRKNTKANVTEMPRNTEAKKIRHRKLEPLAFPKPAAKSESVRIIPTKQYDGCFGFASSWLAKKKEKQPEKKRQAIRARSSGTFKTKLTEYEHKRSRGGVAFTIEFDNRPIRKPLLPPIEANSGPIKLGYVEKLQKAEKKRQEELAQRTRFVRYQEEKRVENAKRKSDNENGIKEKAALTIMAKQGQAKTNQRRQERYRQYASERNCATSVMPFAISDDSLDKME